MANYKRVISYMYQYRNQAKGNNVGFARIETRDTQCKITINIRVPNMKEQDIKSYMYCWYNREMHGVFLGNVHINNGVGELVVKTDVDNIMSSKYRLSDMGGILLYVTDSSYLGTEWDGKAVMCNGLFVDKEKPQDFVDRINKETVTKEAPKPEVPKVEETVPVKKVVPFKPAAQEKPEQQLKGAVIEQQPSSSMEALIEDEVAKEEQDANTMTAAVAEPVEKESQEEVEQEVVTEQPVEQQPVVEQSVPEAESSDTSFPLSKEKIENLDKQAQELFGTMLFNTLFPEEEKGEIKEPSSNQKESVEPEQVQASETIKISPKSAIECFTAFRSCESKEEYEEIQEEIKTMKAQIDHLELLLKEWRIKEERLNELEEAKAVSEQEKIALEEEARESYHIDGVEGDLEAAALTGNVVSRIFNKYPAMQPFKPGEVDACIRIEPQDLGIFPMENWILANNSFLLHGYYSYRHLIFIKTKENGQDRFLLGVPGVNHSRERFMANMFGFNEFRSLAEQEDESGDFGYWCQEIKMHV
ncbi:MAG: DUF6128 domain-containing protein [bacterium]|nr:DUF6128 domain-containing protein [bacterium]